MGGPATDERVDLAALQFSDLEKALTDVGVSITDVAAGGIRMSVDPDRGRAIAVVTTYALDENGRRYFDEGTREIATETHRFLLSGIIQMTKPAKLTS